MISDASRLVRPGAVAQRSPAWAAASEYCQVERMRSKRRSCHRRDEPAWWVRLLKAVPQSIGASIRDGVCEIFPPDTLPENSEFGCAMRAPGSWNPGTETLNLILWHNTKDLTAPVDR
jgi:hypothetical protein